MLTLRRRHWTPRRLPNLKLWLHAPSVTGLNNNDPIGSSWLDRSGNSLHPTVGTGSPTYQMNQKNGLPAVTFDGNDNMVSSFATLAQPFTMYWVGNTVWSGADQMVLAANTASNIFMDRPADTQARASAGGNTVYSSFNNDSWHILGVSFNGASSFGRFDGTQTAMAGLGTNSLVAGLQIGSFGNDTNYQVGATGEIVVTSDAMSADNVSRFEHYASSQWAIGSL